MNEISGKGDLILLSQARQVLSKIRNRHPGKMLVDSFICNDNSKQTLNNKEWFDGYL
jgi:dsDNA-specific endonuclease/ATPase MutS2